MTARAPSPRVYALFLAALVLAVYWPVGGFPFLHYDDSLYVTRNPLVLHGLTRAGIAAAFLRPPPGGWPHPLALLSHMTDVSLFGLEAGAHHAVSVLLHALAAVILFFAFFEMTADPWRSSFVAAVFAVHPLQVESVAWVAERKNVLNGFFVALLLWLYARYAKKPSPGRYLAALAAYALSLAARSVMVAPPLLLLLLDYWPLKRKERWTRLAVEKAPFFALSLACALIALRTAEAVAPAEVFPLSARLANALVSTAASAGRSVWPADLCVLYPFDHGIPFGAACGAGLELLAATAACFYARRKRPWLVTGWLWFLACLAPFSGLVQVGAQATADRYMYLPLIGLALAAAWIFPKRVPEKAKALCAGGAVAALMAASSLQLRWWSDGAALFARATALHPDSALAHVNLGAAFYEDGALDDAVREYRAGLALYPGQPTARNNLAVILMEQGRFQEAEPELEAALAGQPRNPGFVANLTEVRARLRAARPRPPRPSRRPRR